MAELDIRLVITKNGKKTVSVEKATCIEGVPIIYDGGFNYVVNDPIETFDDTMAYCIEKLGFTKEQIIVKEEGE